MKNKPTTQEKLSRMITKYQQLWAGYLRTGSPYLYNQAQALRKKIFITNPQLKLL